MKSVVRKLPASAASIQPAEPEWPRSMAEAPRGVEDSVDAVQPAVDRPAPPRPPAIQPLAPERYRLQLTMGQSTHDTLRRLQDLLAREVPDGDPATIVDRALTLLLKEVEKKKLAATEKLRTPPPTKLRSRHVPAHIRRAVNHRDGGRCAFVSTDDRRCTERRFLEWHHVKPYAAGGEMSVTNISLRCRIHNAYDAEQIFGRFDPSLVREAPAEYVAFGNDNRFSEPVVDRARQRFRTASYRSRYGG